MCPRFSTIPFLRDDIHFLFLFYHSFMSIKSNQIFVLCKTTICVRWLLKMLLQKNEWNEEALDRCQGGPVLQSRCYVKSHLVFLRLFQSSMPLWPTSSLLPLISPFLRFNQWKIVHTVVPHHLYFETLLFICDSLVFFFNMDPSMHFSYIAWSVRS